MPDDHKPERPFGRAKQNRVSGGSLIRRRHQPLLAAVRGGFGTLRARRDLRRGGLRMERAKRKQDAHRLEQLHFGPESRIGRRSETTPRIKSSAFFPTAAARKLPAADIVTARKPQLGRPARPRLVLFRYNRRPKLMQKIHRLTDN
jgi:hypothetical protein